jgi:hypothetical protein
MESKKENDNFNEATISSGVTLEVGRRNISALMTCQGERNEAASNYG